MEMKKRFGISSPLRKRIYGMVLSCLLLFGMLPGTALTVYAESPYDDAGKYNITLYDGSENGDDSWFGIEVEGITDSATGDELNGNFEDQPYWKNDENHAGKLVYGAEDDYNLKYEDGTLYFNGLNLVVNGSGDISALYTNLDLNIVIEADSTIICSDACAVVTEKAVTFSGNGNLTIETTGSDDMAALIAGGNVTNDVAGTITLTSAGGAEGLWWHGDTPYEISGNGNWAGSPLPTTDDEDDWVERANYTDGELHMGYAACYLTPGEYENADICWGGTPEEMEGYKPLFWAHGSTIQEVIDKLNGTEPVTIYDDEGNVSNLTLADLRTDYIRICVSVSNYEAEHAAEQYITSTGDFKGIFVQGGYDKQMTNHPKDGNYLVEDEVYELTEDGKDIIRELRDNYGLDMNGVDIDGVSYISLYNGELYVAYERGSIDAEHPYRFDLGEYITTEEELGQAIWDGYYSDHDLAEPNIYEQILGEDLCLHVNLPFKTLHINSDCDFKLAGMYDENLATPTNPEGINIYFGFLPDTNHTLSFVVDDEDGDGWHEETYTKASLQNDSLRGVLTFLPATSIDGSVVKILMYQHVTSGVVDGNYKEAVAMDEQTIPDAKLLKNVEITDEQLDALENEGAVDIDLSVNQMDTKAAENQTAITDIETELANNNYACENPFYLDFSMSASIRDTQGEYLNFQDGRNNIPLTELTEPVELTVTVPEQLRTSDSTREYTVVRRHVNANGTVQTEMLPAKYDSRTDSLTFETDQFSTYAIVYRDTNASTGSTSDAGSTQSSTQTVKNTPATGDHTPVGRMVLLVCLACGSLVVLGSRKRSVR